MPARLWLLRAGVGPWPFLQARGGGSRRLPLLRGGRIARWGIGHSGSLHACPPCLGPEATDEGLETRLLRQGRPPVTATVARLAGAVELKVRDHGPGIEEGESARVFEPFYRPSGRSEAAGGWGLGLALVRQIAERHGGAVHYETPADGGTCFVVKLPLRSV